MPLDHATATLRLRRDLNDSEQAIADALVATTSLFHTAALAQRDVGGAAPAKVHHAFKRIQALTGGLLEMQAEAARTHSLLLGIGVEVGALEEPTCPDKTFTGAELVEQSAA